MNIWQYHDKQIRKLRDIYNRISKQTQNNLEEIFKTMNIDSSNLYNIAPKNIKNMIDVKIDEWKDKNLLKGYFNYLARRIYNRSRVKNSEILELLIYGAYIEEQSKLDKYEKEIMYDDMNYYYREGQEEVNETLEKKREIMDMSDMLFLSLLAIQENAGYPLEKYKDNVIKLNTDEIYRQVVIDIQQDKKPSIDDIQIQNIIKKQLNSKININGDKISGAVDNQLIELNNKAKVEGIERFDENAKVRFIAVEDEKTTAMCKSLDKQIFNVHDWNIFDRYSNAVGGMKRCRCYGLVKGENLPPIDDHFHWCRSSITYLNTKKGLGSSNGYTEENHPAPKLIDKVNYNDINEVMKCLEKYEKIIVKENIENAIVITRDGDVYQCYGNTRYVWPDDLGIKLNEAYVTHNHIREETEYSFSGNDFSLFGMYNLKILRGVDYKYTYELNRDPSTTRNENIDINITGSHYTNIKNALTLRIGYRRWENGYE